MTTVTPKTRSLSGDQRRAVERACRLAEASATVETLAAYLGVSTGHPGQFFYAAYGAAVDRLRDLLASLDEAGAGQADPGADPPTPTSPPGRSRPRHWAATARPRLGWRRSPWSWRAWIQALTTAGSPLGWPSWMTVRAAPSRRRCGAAALPGGAWLYCARRRRPPGAWRERLMSRRKRLAPGVVQVRLAGAPPPR